MKNLPYKLHKHSHWSNRIILFLICIFIALLYFHGENYAMCKSIYPDEIMDLPFSFFPFLSEDEKAIHFESRDDKQFFSSINIEIFSICRIHSAKVSSLFLEFTHLKDFVKRLSILQCYNSWNLIFGLFHFLVSIIMIPFLILIMKNGS